jgi:nitrogen fixation protein NifU and related proteins
VVGGMEGLYSEIILDHYRSRHGHGLREPFDAESHQTNPLCGDEITLRVRLDEGQDGTTVQDVSYDAQGCSISQASASVLHDLVAGKDVPHAQDCLRGVRQMLLAGPDQVEPDEDLLEDAVAFTGVARFPARVKCALLPWAAFTDAMARAGVPVRDPEDDQERG